MLPAPGGAASSLWGSVCVFQVDPVNGSSIESIAEFRKFKAAVNTVYIMYVDSVIRTRKFIKARKRH